MIPPVDDELRLQSLRRGHSGRVFQVEAHYHSNSRQYVVLWDDILEAFPDATNLLNGTLIVTRARDSALRVIEPRCIKHQPGKVLEIVGGEELAPSSGGSTSMPARDTTIPQQLTQRNIEQWAAMTTTEDTLLGGMYAPTICTLTTTTTVPFRPLIVPTETGASSSTRDDSDREEDKEDEADETHVHIGASGFNQLGVSLSPSLHSSTHNNGKNGDTIGSLNSNSGPKSPTSLPLSSIAYPVPMQIPPPPPAATKPEKLGFLKSTFYRFVGRTPTKSVSSTSGPESDLPPAPQFVQLSSPCSAESPTDMMSGFLYRDATMPLYQQHQQPKPYIPPAATTYTPANSNSTPRHLREQGVTLRLPFQENVNTSTFLVENLPTHNSLTPSKVENGPDSPSSDAGSQDSDQTYTSKIRTLEVIARAQAMFDFPGEDWGDLPFQVGDVINIYEFMNDDWWRGALGKEVGIFPSAYVQKLNPPDKGNHPSLLVKIRKPASLHSLTEQEDSIHTIHPLVTVESQE